MRLSFLERHVGPPVHSRPQLHSGELTVTFADDKAGGGLWKKMRRATTRPSDTPPGLGAAVASAAEEAVTESAPACSYYSSSVGSNSGTPRLYHF